MNWQPIETCPAHKYVLLFEPVGGPEDNYQFSGYFTGDTFFCMEYDAYTHKPTHWRPLLDAPQS